MTEKLFYFLAFLTLLSALMVVLSKNPIHSVLYLILTFFTLTAHYIVLNAQFLAVVNLIVYAGAIMVLFLFVLMFLNLKEDSINVGDKQPILARVAAMVAGGMLLVIMVAALKDVDSGAIVPSQFDSQTGMVQNLGMVLYTKYLLPFELASILFLSAMVGAVMLGKREEGESNTF